MGLLILDGKLYVSHRGKVAIVLADGKLQDIVTGLSSSGDYTNNELARGPDGKIYLAQGTVTNSGIVGPDNYTFGWLDRSTQLHDVPCHDVTTLGQNYRSSNPMDSNSGSTVMTGAYQPFGSPGLPDEAVKGSVKCGGSILRFNPDGSGLQVVAWGLRDPFGLKFDANGQLWATSHGAARRGSRVISNDPDYLVRVQEGAWYGWPDFFDGKPVTDNQFKTPGEPDPGFLWADHPTLSRAFLVFSSQAGANGFDFSPGGAFGFQGDLFVALFGPDLLTGAADGSSSGFRIVRSSVKDQSVTDFASNTAAGPAFLSPQAGFDRPSDVIFGPDDSLYIIDWGAAGLTGQVPRLSPQTGAIWRIYSKSQVPQRPEGPVVVRPPFEGVQVTLTDASPAWWASIAWVIVGAAVGSSGALVVLAALGWQSLQAR